jgi:Asp-tRNA(Asn)/Glu-tRNA(Gln) amidotransferase C subunit
LLAPDDFTRPATISHLSLQKMEKKNVGGITYIKQVPNFLKQMMQLDESGVRARSHP